jgi:hypothetical protein
MSEEIIVPKDKEAALARVNFIAESMGKAEGLLERGYAEFALALENVRSNKYWEGEHESWGKYIEHITNTFKIGRAQLYHKVAVVRELNVIMTPSEITAAGISKASILADAHRAGEKFPEDVIAAAVDSTVTAKDLKRIMAEATHTAPPESSGWYDLGFAFYVTDEERKELQEAEKLALSLDPPVSTSLKSFMQKKEVALRWAREFISTYTGGEDVGF